MKLSKTVPVLAAIAAIAAGSQQAHAQAQLRDQSGEINIQFSVAKWVAVVSHAASTYDLTGGNQDGLQPGGTLDTPDGAVTREIKANTPYRLSLSGLDADGRLSFTSGTGEVVALGMICQLSGQETPANSSDYMEWSCTGSDDLDPTASSFVTLRAYTADPAETENARAGVYTGTVYLQIEAV